MESDMLEDEYRRLNNDSWSINVPSTQRLSRG
jgi:hypothetical protein